LIKQQTTNYNLSGNSLFNVRIWLLKLDELIKATTGARNSLNKRNENRFMSPFEVLIEHLNGILLPSVTPFGRNGDLDLVSFRSNLRKWNETGISGYAILGSTGERVHLDEREYVEVIESARAEVPSGIEGLAFIVGAGQQSTRGTIDEIKRAAEAGADAVLVITPHFYRAAITQEVLVNYYSDVADTVPVPVILYSMPALTGVKIEPSTIARLSQHPNILGVKDSSADVESVRKTKELCPANFAVLTGNGTVLRDALNLGAIGGILAVGCVVPEICVEIFRAFADGDNKRASILQLKLTPLAAAVTTRYGIGGLKAALDMNGYIGGAVRAPLQLPDEAARAEIARLIEDARGSFASLTEEAFTST
jgi:4-hydroxy-2-oxoglutarate aldolase